MGENLIIHLSSQLLWVVLMLSLPIVVVAAVVGVLVSLVQALTQLQDQTVQFLLKLVAVSITLVATYSWMGGVLLTYANQSFALISRMGP